MIYLRLLGDPFLLFVTTVAGVYGVLAFGLRKAVPILLVGFTAAAVVEVLAATLLTSDIVWDFTSASVGIIVGGFLGTKVKYHGSKTYRFLQQVFSDPRVLVLSAAFLFACIITIPFAHFQASENPRGFWHGFYEAWTASIVFFGVLGVAGLVVTFYKPEKDDFLRRVRILCGGRSGPEVDFITYAVRKIGYFAEDVDREVRIRYYDPDRRAYYAQFTITSTNENFYDDVSIDQARIKLSFDPIEPEPPNGVVGKLVSVRVGNDEVCGPKDLDASGYIENWPMSIAKNASQRLCIVYEGYLRTDITHEHSSNRFVKSTKFRFVFEGTNSPPEIEYKIYSHPIPQVATEDATAQVMKSDKMVCASGKAIELGPILNCMPQRVFLTYNIKPAAS
jgi:hypothetical protein